MASACGCTNLGASCSESCTSGAQSYSLTQRTGLGSLAGSTITSASATSTASKCNSCAGDGRYETCGGVNSSSSNGTATLKAGDTPDGISRESKPDGGAPLPITSLNHVSIHCADVAKSVEFYVEVMGFFPVKRPHSLQFEGAWLFKHSIGIHLLGNDDGEATASPMQRHRVINPKSDHLSFQCDNMAAVEDGLKHKGIPFVRQTVEEGGIAVEQLFFHDPDGHMIEICNCNLLPIIPLSNGTASAAGLQDLPSCGSALGCHRDILNGIIGDGRAH